MVDAHGAGLIGYEIQIAIGIGGLVVDGRRRYLVANGENRDAGFEAARAAQQMPGHRFRRTDGDLISILAEAAFDGGGFGAVADFGRRAVSVDVIDLLRLESG